MKSNHKRNNGSYAIQSNNLLLRSKEPMNNGYSDEKYNSIYSPRVTGNDLGGINMLRLHNPITNPIPELNQNPYISRRHQKSTSNLLTLNDMGSLIPHNNGHSFRSLNPGGAMNSGIGSSMSNIRSKP